MSNATLLSSPATPASVYRPMEYKIQGRGQGSLFTVAEVRIADAADVIALGAGLVVGDVLIEHAGVPAEVGDTVFVEGCGSYNGLWTVAKIILDTGSPQYLVITAPDYGDVTPGSGNIIVWPEGYSVYAEVSIYTNPANPPTKVRMRATPNLQGVATFPVDKVVKDFFNSDISAFVLPIVGGGAVQSAHGTTAVFYMTRFVEAWQATPVIDPWDGAHEIDEDADYRVAVNAVHPYSSELVTWETADMGDFVVGGTDFERRFLTHFKRSAISVYTGLVMTLADSDHFRLFMLTDEDESYEVDYYIRVFDMASGSPVYYDTVPAILADPTAAVAFGMGPADLSPTITVPAHYRAFITNFAGSAMFSEAIEVRVDTTCKEVRRPMGAFNSLGGVDLFTFTGREIEEEGATRDTVRKPYSAGTGYDFLERTYNNEPETNYTLSSRPVAGELRKWITKTFSRSANVVLKLSDTQAAPVIITSGGLLSSSTGGMTKPVTIEYRLGIDGLAQRA